MRCKVKDPEKRAAQQAYGVAEVDAGDGQGGCCASMAVIMVMDNRGWCGTWSSGPGRDDGCCYRTSLPGVVDPANALMTNDLPVQLTSKQTGTLKQEAREIR